MVISRYEVKEYKEKEEKNDEKMKNKVDEG